MRSKIDDGILLLSTALEGIVIHHLLHEALDKKDDIATNVLFNVLYTLSNHKHLTLREYRDLSLEDVYKLESIEYMLELCFNYSIEIPKNCDLKS